MALAERGDADRQRAIVERLGLIEPTLVGVQDPQIVEGLRHLRVLPAERFHADLQRAPMQLLGLRITPEQSIQLGQIVAALGDVGMVRPELPLADLERLPVMVLRRLVAALDVQDVAEIVDAGRPTRVVLVIVAAEPERIAEQLLRLGEAALLGSSQPRLADLVPLVRLRRRWSGGKADQRDDQADPDATRYHRHASPTRGCPHEPYARPPG